MQLDDAASILAHADFFEVCDVEQRRLLAFASERRLFARRDVLFTAGETPQGAHVLVAGTLSAIAEGNPTPRLLRETGTVIGATSLIVDKPRYVTVTALTAVETLFVPRAAFLKLARSSPEMAARAADRIRRDIGDFIGAIEPLRKRIRDGG